ncbi:MAG TPA: methyltransferase domain-containing protein [Bacteroidales bacterium]|nr:methyltransferase domain-containing protein [Bacteroidales bacterium]
MNKSIKKWLPRFLMDGIRRYRMNRQLKEYKGDKVQCPICASTFSAFAPFGDYQRPNALCPRCHSLERHRLIWKYLNDQTNLFTQDQKSRLLHFAPEEAFYHVLSNHPKIDYVPCDLSPEKYQDKRGPKVVKVDITDIPFEDRSFDVIICNHVLEHIPDDARAMSELLRVLKKGGWAILMVPLDYNREITYEDFSIHSPQGREEAFGQFDHVRIYGKDYPDRLRKVGFQVDEIDFVKTFSKEDQFRFGLFDQDRLYICTN